jgi:hypothetical protein
MLFRTALLVSNIMIFWFTYSLSLPRQLKWHVSAIKNLLNCKLNRVLRGIFGPNRDEVTGKQRKLHSEELHNLYSSPDIIRQVK